MKYYAVVNEAGLCLRAFNTRADAESFMLTIDHDYHRGLMVVAR